MIKGTLVSLYGALYKYVKNNVSCLKPVLDMDNAQLKWTDKINNMELEFLLGKNLMSNCKYSLEHTNLYLQFVLF